MSIPGRPLQDLNWLVTNFVERVPDAAHAVVVSADGLPLAYSAGFPQDRADQLAAVTSGLASLTQGASRVFEGGIVVQTAVEMQAGVLLIMAVSHGASIAVLAAPTADLGLIAYETRAREGLVLDEDVIVEIVRPGTGDPVPPGEVGEVVVTTFNRDYPMFRFGTGDLSAVLPGISPCGRTNMRIKGWLGRADQTTKVKGMFVHPEQIAELARRHGQLLRVRLVVGRKGEQDTMTLRAETAADDAGLKAKLTETLHSLTKLKGEVELVAPGSLPNDGKVIADDRSYT